MKPLHRWLLAGGLVAGFLCGLAARQDTLQRDRAATCRRALPALAPHGTVRFLSAGPGSAPETVRVDYADGTRQHRLTCRFDGATRLAEVANDGVPLSGPALFMLQRYFLDTPDAATADPANR